MAIMAQEDFDIDRLAAYLHMMPAAVVKLAERGKLPGRRVGGEWRFSAAEIHHWLEDRIGLSDDDALVHDGRGAGSSQQVDASPTKISIADSAARRSDRDAARRADARQRDHRR